MSQFCYISPEVPSHLIDPPNAFTEVISLRSQEEKYDVSL